MKRQHSLRFGWLTPFILLATSGPVLAVTVTVDFNTFPSSFFNAGTTNGAAARATLLAAADLFSGILIDTLEGIQTPPDYQSSAGGTGEWLWTAGFIDPSNGAQAEIDDLTIAANEYRIIVGARNLSNSPINVLGEGSFGDVGYSYNIEGNFNSQNEYNELVALTDEFVDDVTTRGETSGFASWGGSIAFDNVGVNWNFKHTKPPGNTQADLYSVAVHEMAHALGFGGSDEWDALIVGNNFNGSVAKSEYGGPIPLATPEKSHWYEGTMNTALGTSIPQEASMDPSLSGGKRKYFTYLDAAALDDIGWSLNLPDPVPPGDYNRDGRVNAADFTIWRDTFGSNGDLRANGDGDNSIDAGDFTVWMNHYGDVGGSGAAALFVPEPTSATMAGMALVLIARWRRSIVRKSRRQRRRLDRYVRLLAESLVGAGSSRT